MREGCAFVRTGEGGGVRGMEGENEGGGVFLFFFILPVEGKGEYTDREEIDRP